jgi:hypothetical protein
MSAKTTWLLLKGLGALLDGYAVLLEGSEDDESGEGPASGEEGGEVAVLLAKLAVVLPGLKAIFVELGKVAVSF